MSKLTFKQMFPSLEDFDCNLIFHDMGVKNISNEDDKKELEELIQENFGTKFLQCCQNKNVNMSYEYKNKNMKYYDTAEETICIIDKIFDKSFIALTECVVIRGILNNSSAVELNNIHPLYFDLKENEVVDYSAKKRFFSSKIGETRIREKNFDKAIIQSINSDISQLHSKALIKHQKSNPNQVVNEWSIPRREYNTYTVLIFKSEEEVRDNFNILKKVLKEHWSVDLDKDE